MAAGAALVSCFLGAVFGVVVLAILIPVLQQLVLIIGPAEICMLVFLALTFVVVLGKENIVRGLIAGLARPDSLRRTVEQLGATVVAERTFGDHHRYRQTDFLALPTDVPIWVTTEKDAVKITPAWVGGTDIRVLSIALEVASADLLVDWLLERLGPPATD